MGYYNRNPKFLNPAWHNSASMFGLYLQAAGLPIPKPGPYDPYTGEPIVSTPKHFNPLASENQQSNQRPGDAIHTLQGFIHAETQAAILFEVDQVDGSPLPESLRGKHWFPLSQVKSITRAPVMDGGEIEYDNLQIKEWLLVKKGLI